ncbi:MAG: hemolysin III family protein [Gemmatimonadetes bacterium]|nr:hemolysin III family protein [Gemmatimonadota bacterium]MCC6774149.1 hemolysin III family protein [Gemmatimonadaceae bacterium]
MTSMQYPSRSEEWANALTHGAGLLASLAALPFLVLGASRTGDMLQVIGAAVFGTTLILLYGASVAYHAVSPSPRKLLLRRLDHSAIYLLIAGTYTPFALGPLRGAWGWTLLVAVWSMAAVGVGIKSVRRFGGGRLSTALYIGMGWFAVVAIGPLIDRVGWSGLQWLLAGGLAYTGGVVFYATDHRVKFGHAVWHLFVLAGSVLHVVAVLNHSALSPVA